MVLCGTFLMFGSDGKCPRWCYCYFGIIVVLGVILCFGEDLRGSGKAYLCRVSDGPETRARIGRHINGMSLSPSKISGPKKHTRPMDRNQHPPLF
ncbi:hypothetical protein P154DRAFT_19271 [Amniculicola lignicola CBS 123094]|uniref:Uncharacterized protein n=1 Tax=Amniculicola lignicola CBS 123094 TaxID=1392246 RepID=A0A6A5WT96_9PLEO|nr:hypothetical protein P154DRAFT_19271 [Amniculicola lignicola CBS 123094]